MNREEKARKAYEVSDMLREYDKAASAHQMYFDNHYDGMHSAGHGPDCDINECESVDAQEWKRAIREKHALHWRILETLGFTVWDVLDGRKLRDGEAIEA